MEQKRRMAAALSAAAIMTVIGVGGATAQTQPEAGNAAKLVKAQSGPEGTKEKACVDIDSTGNENSEAKYVGAVCDGRVYVLTVDETVSPPAPIGGWVPVGGPTKVVDVTLASNTEDVSAPSVFVTALTKYGEVWEGVCPNSEPIGTCTFTQLPKPPA